MAGAHAPEHGVHGVNGAVSLRAHVRPGAGEQPLRGSWDGEWKWIASNWSANALI